jgi:hypothetical protein
MSAERYKEEVAVELQMLAVVISEIESINTDAASGDLASRDFFAAQLLLVNLYNGMENILKRTCKFLHIQIPSGADSHTQIALLFSQPQKQHPLTPIFITPTLKVQMTQLRRFRHVILHGYGFALDKKKIQIALEEAPSLYRLFRHEVEKYNADLPS